MVVRVVFGVGGRVGLVGGRVGGRVGFGVGDGVGGWARVGVVVG